MTVPGFPFGNGDRDKTKTKAAPVVPVDPTPPNPLDPLPRGASLAEDMITLTDWELKKQDLLGIKQTDEDPVEKLNETLDKAFNKFKNDCADAVIDVAKQLGVDGIKDLDPDTTNADDLLGLAKEIGKKVSFEEAQKLANRGEVVVGGLTSEQLKSQHGHVQTVRPGELKPSSNFGGRNVPNVMNASLGGKQYREGRMSGGFKKGSPDPDFYHVR